MLEGESATFVVDLELDNASGTSSKDVVIDYTVSGTGSNPAEEEDYAPQSEKLTIRAGQSSGTIEVRALPDDILEPAEMLRVTLDDASPDDVVSESDTDSEGNKWATTTIGDPPGTSVTVDVKDTTVDEGETALITVELSGEVDSEVSVSYTIAAGTPPATAHTGSECSEHDGDQDFLEPSAQARSVSIPRGETTATILIKTCDDTVAEASETFTVTLQPITSPDDVSRGERQATVTITDDALTATIEGDASVDEGEAAVYTVTVTGGTFGTGEDDQVTVTWSTEDSSATPNDDFTPASGTLVIGAEEPSATFTIRTVEDDIPELGEIIEVSLTAQTVVDGETEAVRTGAAARTMIDDDDGAVEVSITADQTVVAEGQRATFTVELTGAVAEALTLRYTTVDGTATAGTDYTPAGGVAAVEIAAGEMSTTITVVTSRPDDQDEIPDEIFSVRLLDDGLPEDVAIETPTASVRITDHEISARVDSDQETVNEGSAVVFTVSLNIGSNLAGAQNRTGVEVDYEVVGDVTTADYREPSTGTVTFPSGVDEAAITITTIPDNVLDPRETLTLSLTDAMSLPDDQGRDQGLAVVDPTAGADSTEVVDGGSVRWSVEDITVPEGDPAVFMVTMDGRRPG